MFLTGFLNHIGPLSIITITIAALFASWYRFSRQRCRCYENPDQSFYVITVVNAIKKVCPVNSSNKWVLLDSAIGSPRCWKQDFELMFLNGLKINIKIYGSNAVIHGSSLETMKLISDTEKWVEWKPMITADAFSTELFDEPNLHQDHFMNCEKITSGGSLKFYRFSIPSTNNSGWILLWGVKKLEWSFFLVEPLFTKDFSYCMLTFIYGCYPPLKDNSAVNLLMSTVNAMKEAVEMSKILLSPLDYNVSSVFLAKRTSNVHVKSTSFQQLGHKINSNVQEKAFKLVLCMHGGKAEAYNLKKFFLCIGILGKDDESETKDVPSSYSQDDDFHIHDKSNLFKIRSRNENDMKDKFSSASNFYSRIDSHKETNYAAINNRSQYSVFKQKFEGKCKSSATKQRSSTFTLFSEKSKSLKAKNIRSFSDANLCSGKSSSKIISDSLDDENSEYEINHASSEDCNSTSERENHSSLKVSVMDDPSIEENIMHADKLDYEILLPRIDSAQLLTDIKTNGNYGTSELQAEIFEASEIGILRCMEDQSLSLGRWVYHSTYKGVTVLSKVSTSGHFNVLSFIGRTEINMKASDVWKEVRNHNLRFICDETVKKVKVLEQISDDQKIIHTYHEIHHLLKKEEIDFCLLHTERVEQSKYYLAIQSIEYVNCPLMDGVTRGMLLPSGWVLIPSKENCEVTVVNFLFKVLVNNPGSLFIQGLEQSVPLCLFNLKKYLML